MNEKKTLTKGPISLAPKDFEVYKNKAELLVKEIDSQNIRSVGITSSYGSGKSSFLKEFIKVYNQKHKNRKIKEISFCNITPSGQSEDVDEIELSIVRQLLLAEKPSKLPDSSIKRIGKKPQKRNVFFTFLTLSFSILLFLLFYFGYHNKEYVLEKYFCNSYSSYFQVGFCLLFGAFVLLALSFGLLFYFFNGLRLKVKNVEIELTSNTEEKSPFFKFSDELLYFFRVTKTKIVIFEDLDRFEKWHIYDKIRELHTLINNSNRIKVKPVIFIYALKNEPFIDASTRTKYFDLIVPINPILSKRNAIDNIKDSSMFGNLYDWLDDDFFVEQISPFFTEMRLLISTYNDCCFIEQDFKHNKVTKIENKEIFCIRAYANLFPVEFEHFEKDDEQSKLSEILNQIRLIEKTSNPFNFLEKNISYLDNFKLDLKFKKFLKVMIENHYLNYKSEYILIINNLSSRYTIDETSYLDNLQNRLHDESVFDMESIDYDRLIRSLKDSDFNLPQICNFGLFLKLLSASKYSNRLERVINAIANPQPQDTNYVSSFIVFFVSRCLTAGNQEPLLKFLLLLGTKRFDLFKILENLGENFRKDGFLSIFLALSEFPGLIKNQVGWDKSLEFISDYDGYINHLNELSWTIPLLTFNNKSEDIETLKLNRNTVELLLNSNQFVVLNYKNLESILNLYDIPNISDVIYSGHYTFQRFPAIFNFIKNNLVEYAKNILLPNKYNNISSLSLADYCGTDTPFDIFKAIIEQRDKSCFKEPVIYKNVFDLNKSLFGHSQNIFNQFHAGLEARLKNTIPYHKNEQIVSDSLAPFLESEFIDKQTKLFAIESFLTKDNCSQEVCKTIVFDNLFSTKNDLVFESIADYNVLVDALISFYKATKDFEVLKARMMRVSEKLSLLFSKHGLIYEECVNDIPRLDDILLSFGATKRKFKNTYRWRIK